MPLAIVFTKFFFKDLFQSLLDFQGEEKIHSFLVGCHALDYKHCLDISWNQSSFSPINTPCTCKVSSYPPPNTHILSHYGLGPVHGWACDNLNHIHPKDCLSSWGSFSPQSEDLRTNKTDCFPYFQHTMVLQAKDNCYKFTQKGRRWRMYFSLRSTAIF